MNIFMKESRNTEHNIVTHLTYQATIEYYRWDLSLTPSVMLAITYTLH